VCENFVLEGPSAQKGIEMSDNYSYEEQTKELKTLKVELRNRMHRIYSSFFLIENKISDNTNNYELHSYMENIRKELDCIRDKIIH
jgi:hypothetical protein